MTGPARAPAARGAPDGGADYRDFIWSSQATMAAEVGPDGRVEEANGALALWLGADPRGVALTDLVAASQGPLVRSALDAVSTEWRRIIVGFVHSADDVPRDVTLGVIRHGSGVLALAEPVADDVLRAIDSVVAINEGLVEAERTLRGTNRTLERMSLTDALTGAQNRRAFDSRLARFVGGTGAVVSMDIDHFKLVNDTHGHAVGDGVLVDFVREVTLTARSTDFVARVGGEEFCVLLVGSSLAAAAAWAERCRARVAGATLGGLVGTTASFGVTNLLSTDDAASVLARSDAALYRAKTGGRNRVESTA